MAINLRSTVNKSKLKEKLQSETSNQGGSDFLPYFKLKNNDTLTLRFLSDANPENQDFFIFTETIFNFNGKNMKFDGPIKDCPASKKSAEFYNNDEKEMGLKFYRKKKYLANAYIVDAPDYFWTETGIDPDDIKQRVKVISMPSAVYENVKDTIMDADYDEFEFYNFGDNVLNYKLKMKAGTKGSHNDYSLSKFAGKVEDLDLDDDEIDEIAEALKDLSTMFKSYTAEEFEEAIEIELSDDEDDEDEDDRPAKKKAPASKKSAKKVVEEDDEDEDEDEDEDDEEEEAPKKPSKKPAKKVVEEDDEDEDEDDEEEEAPKKPSKKPAKKVVEEDDEDEDEEDEDEDDAVALRTGILKKLNIKK